MIDQLTRRRFAQYMATCMGAAAAYRYTSAAELLPRDQTNLDLVQANNALAIELLKRFAEKKPADNQFFSPLSIDSALLIALEGADGQTAVQMGRALQLPASLQLADGMPDRQVLANDFTSLRDSIEPLAADLAGVLRKQVSELKGQLTKANDTANKLMQARKFAESAKASDEAAKLAGRINELSKSIDPFTLTMANSLWVDRTYPLSDDYVRRVDRIFGTSTANACDFQGATDAERVRINRWVADHTQDKIRDIIPAGVLSPETRLVIANAIYFKGNWAKPFEASRTASAEFTDGSLAKKQVSMMFAPALKEASYAAFRSDGTAFQTPRMVTEEVKPAELYPDQGGYQVLELPYVGEKLSMLVILPQQPDGLNKLLSSMNLQQFNAIRGQLQSRPVHVKLPKFKLATNYNLIPDLQALGMQDAFSPELADFSGLTKSKSLDHRLYISMVIHKAFVEVNEEGTEAAAATVVGMARAAAPVSRPFTPEFTADHPFLFCIFDKTTKSILFMGAVNSCSA
jgi:serine protease inhibitor